MSTNEIEAELDKMYATPGVYVVLGDMYLFYVETLPDGTCHQLKPDTKERDGELSRSGWNELFPLRIHRLRDGVALRPAN